MFPTSFGQITRSASTHFVRHFMSGDAPRLSENLHNTVADPASKVKALRAIRQPVAAVTSALLSSAHQPDPSHGQSRGCKSHPEFRVVITQQRELRTQKSAASAARGSKCVSGECASPISPPKSAPAALKYRMDAERRPVSLAMASAFSTRAFNSAYGLIGEIGCVSLSR